MKTNHHTKIKLSLCLVLTALIAGTFGICPLAFAQTDISPTPTQAPLAQPTSSSQIRGMDQMASMDSMKRMADMCQQMMKSEQATMPFIIGGTVLFAVLLFVALVLLIVLEIQWIKYWSRLLNVQKKDLATG